MGVRLAVENFGTGVENDEMDRAGVVLGIAALAVMGVLWWWKHGMAPSSPMEPQVAKSGAAYLTPINFFGRVVDQDGNPVPAAEVKCYANDNPGPEGSNSVQHTDSEGFFSIEGVMGISLAVEVSKAGYRMLPPSDATVTSSGVFDYAAGTNIHVPDPAKPVIFRLHNIGTIEPLVRIGEKNFRIPRDGTPLVVALDGQGTHEVTLRCWNSELRRAPGERQYDWRLEVAVLHGGLLIRTNDFAFEAPQDGYAPMDIVDMPASLQDQWRSFAERSYFIRFDDSTFARVRLRMRAAGDHFVVWESFYNPKAGSRDLEATVTD